MLDSSFRIWQKEKETVSMQPWAAQAAAAISNLTRSSPMVECYNPDCVKHVVCRYIRKNGKIIYPKRAAFFSFCTKKKAARPRKQAA